MIWSDWLIDKSDCEGWRGSSKGCDGYAGYSYSWDGRVLDGSRTVQGSRG